MKHKLKIFFLIIIFFQSFLISGCWDSKEVEDLAMVTIIGWDKITENGIKKWQVSAGIINPGRTQNEQSAPKSKLELITKGKGMTVQEGFNDFGKRMPRSAFYGNSSIILIGEQAAKDNIEELTELALRYPETRPRTFLFVTKGEAIQVLQAEPVMASTISQEITRLAEDKAERAGVANGVPIYEFMELLLNPFRDAVLPQIKLYYPEKGKETIPKSAFIEGLGVFRRGKLAGWLNMEEVLGYLLITRKINRAQIPLPVSKNGRMFSYWLTSSKSKIEVRMTGNKPSFVIKITTLGSLTDNNGLALTPSEIKALEKVTSKKIRKLTLQTIMKAKKYDADFLGLMEKIHRFKPSAWKKIAPKWREVFQEADVDVHVEVKIVNGGKLDSLPHPQFSR